MRAQETTGAAAAGTTGASAGAKDHTTVRVVYPSHNVMAASSPRTLQGGRGWPQAERAITRGPRAVLAFAFENRSLAWSL